MVGPMGCIQWLTSAAKCHTQIFAWSDFTKKTFNTLFEFCFEYDLRQARTYDNLDLFCNFFRTILISGIAALQHKMRLPASVNEKFLIDETRRECPLSAVISLAVSTLPQKRTLAAP
jgi:hypothetical protein